MKQTLLNTLLQTGLNVILYAVLVRLLPEDEMRTWILFLTLVAFAEMTRHGFIFNTTIRFLANQPSEKASIASAALVLGIGASMLVSGILVGASLFFGKIWQASGLMAVSFGYLALGPATALLKWKESLLFAEGNYRAITVSAAIFAACLFGGLGIAYMYDTLSLLSIVLIQAGASFLAFLGTTLIFPNGFSLRLRQISHLRELSAYGRCTAGTGLLSMVFNKADMLILGILLPGPAIILYDAATRLYTYLDLPINSISQIYFKRLSHAFGQNDSLQAKAVFEEGAMRLFQIMLPLAIGIWIMAPICVQILSGSNYADAAPLLQILVLATVIKPWGRMGGLSLDAAGMPHLNLRMLLISAVVNLSLNVVLIHYFGTTGAALATVLSVWITIAIAQTYVRRVLPSLKLKLV